MMLARALRRAVAPSAAKLPSLLARPQAARPTRLLTSSSTSLLPAKSLGVGSGVGGKADKAAAAKEKAKLEKERAKAKAKAVKDKEKERAKAARMKEKEKEKAKAKAAKEKEKLKAAKEKAKAKPKRKVATKKAKAAPKAKMRSSLHPPKVPGNSWLLFLEEFTHARMESRQPGDARLKVADYARLAVPEYRALSASDKAELLERVQQRKDAYPAKYDEWLNTLTPEMIKEENALRMRRRKTGLKAKKPLRPQGEPKRPMTSYLLYAQSCRPGGVNANVTEGESDIIKQSTLVAASWRQLSAEDKAVFEEEAKIQKERYSEEKAAFDEAQRAKEASKASATA